MIEYFQILSQVLDLYSASKAKTQALTPTGLEAASSFSLRDMLKLLSQILPAPKYKTAETATIRNAVIKPIRNICLEIGLISLNMSFKLITCVNYTGYFLKIQSKNIANKE